MEDLIERWNRQGEPAQRQEDVGTAAPSEEPDFRFSL